MSTRSPRFALTIAFLLLAATADAQRTGYSYLSYVGSEVSLVSNADDDSSARRNMPILAGDGISTGSTSRAEAILADGNILRIDVQTKLRFDRLAKTYEAEDDRNALYLERGAVSLEHRVWTSSDLATRIDTDDATVVFPSEGLLRVETGRRGTEIYVVSGQAEVYARSGRAVLHAGRYAFASGDATLEAEWLDEPRDQFTRFVGERRGLLGAGPGTPHVSAEYGYDYAASGLDLYGSWILVDGSYVWRPSVAADWRPFSDGTWRWSPAGLTWVSYESWGWLPYHYGTWNWNADVGWYWSPDDTYSPAWVYWSYTPSWVGWCPIGTDGGDYGGDSDGYAGGDQGGGDPVGYPRSQRHSRGAEHGTLAYPHSRGPVDVTRIDPRGWSYTSTSRIGRRLDARRDVLGHESVGFRPGERGLVATTPLRIDLGRGGSATTAVQEAVRRVPKSLGAESSGGRDGEGLTPVLRREGTLGATAQESLRRSFETPGRNRGVGRDDGWRSAGSETRSGATPPRTLEVPSRGAVPAAASSETPRSEAPPSRAYEAGRFEAPPTRSTEAPHQAPAPRFEAPPSRSYEAPRSAPAPAPAGHSYEAPPRIESAPAPASSAPSPSSSGSAAPRSAAGRG